MKTCCRRLGAVALLAVFVPPGSSLGAETTTELHGAEVRKHIGGKIDGLLDLYKELHRNPELSFEEKRTASRLAKELRSIGFEVTEGVGGTGLVGLFRNGDGPTIMVRADMDALPVVEATGLEYASEVRTRGSDGRVVGVMHACGHDMHMACWVGTARVLTAMRDRWSGTLMFVAQPAEERGAGAKNMLADGLFERFPKPDFALALHCESFLPHGTVGYTEGLALANVDSVDITVHGRGGHGSAPHTTIDPIVLAARIITDLQTIVSREIDPLDAGVVTVGSIHGGSKHNVIPNEVHLQLTVRSFEDSVRRHLLDGIERIAKAAAMGARAPEPTVKIDVGEFTPALYNDPKLSRRTVAVFENALGAENVIAKPPIMGGEDFARYGRAGVPIFLFRLGTVDPQRYEEFRSGGTPLPSLHSDSYYPVPEPSLKTGVLSMSLAVLNLLGRE